MVGILKMRIYTSNFEKLDKIVADDKVGVAICLKCPSNYEGYWIPELAPTQEMLREYHQNWDIATYTERYQKILSKLNANEIYDRLKEYSLKKDVVMLCYEAPGEFCHRHLVSLWFKETLGETIEEYL